jgi:malto-oligosyltrehalose synthase/4-alpha-glucanotransferase
MFNPISTYRLQFQEGFTLSDLRRLLPYFKALGIKTLYASPLTRAVPGSKHGYDQVNPNQVNPEIGTTQQLKDLALELKQDGIAWIQDIVPNHMAYHHDNAWLMDVLEKGKESSYSCFFDIQWSSGRLLAPFLSAPAEEAIEKGELILTRLQEKTWFQYSDHYFPIHAPGLQKLTKLHPDAETAVNLANEDPHLLRDILNEQHYELVHWQATDRRINYRRFFTVNGLICMNAQEEQVFEETHRLIACLTNSGVFQGLRIDHIDGLYNPGGYLEKLRQLAGENTHLVVEKILQSSDELPHSWPMQGTTGYDYLALVNNLLVNYENKQAFRDFYAGLTDNKRSPDEQAREKKMYMLQKHMAGELDNLYRLAFSLKLVPEPMDGSNDFKKVLAAFLTHCPVYRYYFEIFPLSTHAAAVLQEVFKGIPAELPEHQLPALALLEDLFLKPQQDLNRNKDILHFFRCCMQLSGPLMAKGVEDTFMYTYNCFIGTNDVGHAPGDFGSPANKFHEAMAARAEKWPLSLNATSTHDTKRGEDVRARLAVLTDMPQHWFRQVEEWRDMNQNSRQKGAPDENDEYFIYQTLVGAWPFEEEELSAFSDRLSEYLPKALREGKRNSTWEQPDAAYEKKVIGFTQALLKKGTDFQKSIHKFIAHICDHSIVNSLTQLILKFTCPGVPDTYQGTELWDLSLVDPDNRQPVNYARRIEALEALKRNTDPEALWHRRKNGHIKLHFLHCLLAMRQAEASLFEKGLYEPLKIQGKYKDHVVAFARRYSHTWCVVAVPVHTATLKTNDITHFDWKDTSLLLPDHIPGSWKHLLFDREGQHEGVLLLREIFKPLPFAVLSLRQPENKRAAGVLLALSSLPSPYGIGDLGTGARRFVDFLSLARQSYWQLLPLNPVDAGHDFSPYSSVSSMAGNTLLISPWLLAEEGLLEKEELPELEYNSQVDYHSAQTVKASLLEKAYHRFKNRVGLQAAYKEFCDQEAEWLNDFTLYTVLKEVHKSDAWYYWPAAYRERDANALQTFARQQTARLDFIKWQQFLFHRQWQALRQYSQRLGIKLFGDLPFYLSHDSAEVWARPELFMLDDHGEIACFAGVPPDYFSETGQLWHMPTYNWENMQKDDYAWWITRLRKNLKMFDLLRIDHFRAFAEYWEVPAGETTAENGCWREGPGMDFFTKAREQLGTLPIVAEDLGYHMEKAYRLRDEAALPGMKVLQYAFGENLPESVDIPHNYDQNCIVYTGTHDNNTTRGWYRQETGKPDRLRLEHYLGKKISERNVSDALIQAAYASVARTAIIPMQDLLNLDETARMNQPGKGTDNWRWRLVQQPTAELEKKLAELAKFYNRG